MSVRSKKTSSKSRMKRSHHSLGNSNLRVKEGEAYLPHRVSPSTGMYKGRAVIDVSKRKRRLEIKREKLESSKKEDTDGKKTTEESKIPDLN